MLLMRKRHCEFRYKPLRSGRGQESIPQAWKYIPRGIFWSHSYVAISTNAGSRPFARKELRTMAIQAGGVFGKIGDVRKGFVSLANLFPVLRRKLMTVITCQLLFVDVRLMREAPVVYLRLRRGCWLATTPSLTSLIS